MKTYTADQILKILRSIEKVELDECGALDTWFNDAPPGWEHVASSINSFTPGSFTYDLLVLIENHMHGVSDAEPTTPS